MEGQCRQLARKARVWHSAKHRALRPTTAVRVPAIAPLDFDWRSATSAQTQRIIQQRYPELTDLVQSGENRILAALILAAVSARRPPSLRDNAPVPAATKESHTGRPRQTRWRTHNRERMRTSQSR